MSRLPLAVDRIPARFCKALAYLFTDIDDTLTVDGLLPDYSYSAVAELARSGIQVVPVTGRPAGWCDHIARMWPVAGVVGENGAFYYSYDRRAKRMKRRSLIGEEEVRANRERLLAIAARVLREVPGSAIAADQPFRLTDVAIDYCEDVPRLGRPEVERISAILRDEGVSYKVSSIHVNYWVGSFDKVACVKRFLEEMGGRPFEEWLDRIVFIGDSPNDEPMFRELRYTIAVANIRSFLPDLDHPPRFITRAPAAKGFVEAAACILKTRTSRARTPEARKRC